MMLPTLLLGTAQWGWTVPRAENLPSALGRLALTVHVPVQGCRADPELCGDLLRDVVHHDKSVFGFTAVIFRPNYSVFRTFRQRQTQLYLVIQL